MTNSWIPEIETEAQGGNWEHLRMQHHTAVTLRGHNTSRLRLTPQELWHLFAVHGLDLLPQFSMITVIQILTTQNSVTYS